MLPQHSVHKAVAVFVLSLLRAFVIKVAKRLQGSDRDSGLSPWIRYLGVDTGITKARKSESAKNNNILAKRP